MAVIRLEALSALAAHVEAQVPRLAGRVVAGRASRSEELDYPSLAIYPVRWKYLPDQSVDIRQVGIDRVISCVGRHEATIQLRLAESNQDDRYELEQALVDLFLADEDRPGILLSDVSLFDDDINNFRAIWEMDEDEWENEAAFDEHYQSICVLTGTIPALVTRTGRYTIDEIKLGITHEFDTILTETAFDADAEVTSIVEEEG